MEQILSSTVAVSMQCSESPRTVSLTLRDGQSGAPLVSQDIQADAAVRVDVGVVDAGGEVDFRGLERVVGREVDR
jgi:hypothetical protein